MTRKTKGSDYLAWIVLKVERSFKAKWTARLFVLSVIFYCFGCGGPPRSVLEFKTPRIFLHVYEEPGNVKPLLETDGPKIETRKELENADADFIITGTGTIHWGAKIVQIKENGIIIDSTLVKSRAEGYRNVTMMKDGKVEKDRFIPFEPPWGYHPRD